MRLLFGKKAARPEAKPSVPETATLDTNFGPMRMDRMQLGSGAVAYLCHNASNPENARLDVHRVEYVPTDRNHSESHDADNVMSEETPVFGKSDFIYCAERLCGQQENMDAALVVVFFDHVRDTTGDAFALLKEVRTKFPATRPNLDLLKKESEKPGLRLVQPPAAHQPAAFNQCGLCG